LSRQKSARAAKPDAKAKPAKATAKPARVAKASAAGRPRGVYVQQPKSDVYVALLGLSLFCMLLACLFLFLVWSRYELKTKPTAQLTSTNAAGLLV
jgi:hypothetical protein